MTAWFCETCHEVGETERSLPEAEVDHAMRRRCNGRLDGGCTTVPPPARTAKRSQAAVPAWPLDIQLAVSVLLIAIGGAIGAWNIAKLPNRDEFNAIRDAVDRSHIDCVMTETRVRDAQDDVAAMRRALHDLEVRHVRR